MKKTFLLAIIGAVLYLSGFTQTAVKDIPRGWHMLDPQKDGYYGIDVEKAYNELLKGKKSVPVIVAVIDSGIDTTHEDLKPVLWHNPGEIPGNGIDDDNNGYIDDVYGWNFLGGKDGRNVNKDSYEAARVYYKLKKKFGDTMPDEATATPEELDEIGMYKKVRDLIEGDAKEASLNVMFLKNIVEKMPWADSILQSSLKMTEYSGDDLQKFKPASADESKAKSTIMALFLGFQASEMTNKRLLEMTGEFYNGEKSKADAVVKEPKDYRGEIVKDNYDDINDRYYGNNDVMAGTPMHGTHVSGIIAAARNNNIGMNGIADNVRIMTVRAVPDGDEHDKDIANAIRYAVDNGAKVINMSFGKSVSPQKHWVDDAVKYAASKGVLLVHAAGNDAKDIDIHDNFPNPIFKNDSIGRAGNWITVGASGDPAAGGIIGSFSNYGKKEVDVFAPGVKIYSTLPGGNQYGNLQGTSMASPVVAGVAALLMSYYPNLTVQQIKEVIEKSAASPGIKAQKPGTDEAVSMAELSRAGGIVNVYEAVKLADSISGEKNVLPQQALPKSKMKKDKKG
ncbi:S8 family peptidase [Agriterribacter sp.]|uniref:S8 family peptidase n=1 Tax=Agriterribacter sp. TaxID=2821509 RepID=UPI002B85295E|nr:S8 family peptidase [Agriterribacter sp.]HRO45514.1 S8 family peptidase [Agriterribacter sp.]HRQ19460.1 S8 family peptidase [Agriterribacter sp.]